MANNRRQSASYCRRERIAFEQTGKVKPKVKKKRKPGKPRKGPKKKK